MKIKMYQWILFGFILLMSGVTATGCKKEEPEPYDYRSEVMGAYIGTIHRRDTNWTTQECYDTSYTAIVRVIEGTASDRIDIASHQYTLDHDYNFTRYNTSQSTSSSGYFGGIQSGHVTMIHTTTAHLSGWISVTSYTGTRQ